jgi:hypothetical protein
MKYVFLHVPKTAGQFVHNKLMLLVGKENTSPVRVHSQGTEEEQYKDGYNLYSGHLDWSNLDLGSQDSFVFTILRDPRERIGSFYFYLLDKAKYMKKSELKLPENFGLQKILEFDVDEYFFGGDERWNRFILNHYDNFFTTYYSTKLFNGRGRRLALGTEGAMQKAVKNLSSLNGVYTISELNVLEQDLTRLSGKEVDFGTGYVNGGPLPQEQSRWNKLLSSLASDKNRTRMGNMVELDLNLFSQLNKSF